MDWEHYQTVDPPKAELQAGRGLFGVHLRILHFKFQFSKSIKSSTFHIFLNLTYPFRKNISVFPKIPKKSRTNESDRDVGRKAMLSDVKQPSRLPPP